MKNMFLLVTLFCAFTFGQGTEPSGKIQDGSVPLSLIFYDIGQNTLHSITYNYGLNFIGAGLETWALIETGIDWKWRNIAYDNDWLSNAGIPGFYIGFAVPCIMPAATYITGRATGDEKLQITGLALAQDLVIVLGITSVIKASTGRAKPGLVNELTHTRSSRADDFSNEFHLFNMNFTAGWPSGHTAAAFMAAATVSELYHDNLWLNVGMYSYAAVIGFGQSVSVHWASEIFAGALIGYAVGKTVGKSYRKLLENNGNAMKDNKISMYASYNAVGIIIVIGQLKSNNNK
jgi:membrane-associated phospholipid phosphatase